MAAPRDLEDALAVLSMKLRNASCAAFVLGESIEILGRSPSGAAFFLSTVLEEVADQVLELGGVTHEPRGRKIGQFTVIEGGHA